MPVEFGPGVRGPRPPAIVADRSTDKEPGALRGRIRACDPNRASADHGTPRSVAGPPPAVAWCARKAG